MTRGSGKFKAKRGGGRKFSSDLGVDEEGNGISPDDWKKQLEERGKVDEEGDEDQEEEKEKDVEVEEEEDDSNLSRAERKAKMQALNPRGKLPKGSKKVAVDNSDKTSEASEDQPTKLTEAV